MRIADIFAGGRVWSGSAKSLPALLGARFPMGNFLVLTDEENALAEETKTLLEGLPRRLAVVTGEEEDLLPLFLEPDKITCAVGVGGGISAARYFAAVRSLPCVAVCPSPAPYGAGGKEICVCVGGEKVRLRVALPDLLCRCGGESDGDTSGARAFLALCRVAAFSCDACRRLYGEEKPSGLYPQFRAAADCQGESRETLFCAVAAAEYCLSEGFPGGEAFALARLYPAKTERDAEADAACAAALAKVYALFFGSGFYRGGKVDYRARREEAERRFPEEATDVRIPSAESLAARAAAFAENRAALSSEIDALVRVLPSCAEDAVRRAGKIIRFLPELCGCGISALMRDFGLL